MKMASLALLLLFVLSPRWMFAEDDLQRSINETIQAGGGDIIVSAGTHILEHGLMLRDAKNLRLIGACNGQTILQLAPVAYAYPVTEVKAGAVSIPIKQQRGIVPGMQLHIEAPGAIEPFTGKPKPFHIATVKAMEAKVIHLAAPLEFPIPDGALIRDHRAPNLIEIRGASENIRIENLILDGGRMADDPRIRGHVHLCGISAFGAYGYESGPNGPQIRNLTVTNCTIQNCHGRGISMYASENATIHHCAIHDVTDEAINLDHFTVRSLVTHNRIFRSPVGIELNDVTDCLIVGNEIRECAIGLKLWRWCRQDGLNEGNLIVRNVLEQTAGNAVEIGTGTRRNVIAQNQISNSGKNGIVVAGEEQIVQANKMTACAGENLLISGDNHQVNQPADR